VFLIKTLLGSSVGIGSKLEVAEFSTDLLAPTPACVRKEVTVKRILSEGSL